MKYEIRKVSDLKFKRIRVIKDMETLWALREEFNVSDLLVTGPPEYKKPTILIVDGYL